MKLPNVNPMEEENNGVKARKISCRSIRFLSFIHKEEAEDLFV
jgi:hypothetical protein